MKFYKYIPTKRLSIHKRKNTEQKIYNVSFFLFIVSLTFYDLDLNIFTIDLSQ